MPIAAVAVAGLLLEGTATDWSGLLISRDLRGGGAVGSGVVVALSVAMFVSRSAGDAVMARVGRVRYLFGSSTVTALASVALLAENEDEDVPRSCECPAHTAPAELGSHLQRVR